MPAKPTYWELLRHPQWQQKRLEVMQRAKFECENCGTNEITLNVHHKYYTKGAKPWEYPDAAFECLCEPCHKTKHRNRDRLNILVAAFESSFSIDELIGFIEGRLLLCCESASITPDSEEMAYGAAISKAIEDPIYAGWFWSSLTRHYGQSLDEDQFDNIFQEAREGFRNRLSAKQPHLDSTCLLAASGVI